MGLRHKNRGGPKGAGTPDAMKDRSAHEAARGRKKLSLQELARQLPSEDNLKHYWEHIKAESDRGAAVMAAALVERALEDSIRKRLTDPGDGTANSWFEGINAPFRTFSSKISLGRALNQYDAPIEALLVVIKNIRNAFAHGMTPLNFSHPTLAAECIKLRSASVKPKDWVLSPRLTFAYSCLTLARMLGMDAVAQAHLDEVGEQSSTTFSNRAAASRGDE